MSNDIDGNGYNNDNNNNNSCLVSFLKQANPNYFELPLTKIEASSGEGVDNNENNDNNNKESLPGSAKILNPFEMFSVLTSHLINDDFNQELDDKKDSMKSKKRKRYQKESGSISSGNDNNDNDDTNSSVVSSSSSVHSDATKTSNVKSIRKKKTKENLQSLIDLKNKVLEELDKAYFEVKNLQTILKYSKPNETRKFDVFTLVNVERMDATKKKQLIDLSVHFLKCYDDLSETEDILDKGIIS